MRYGIPLLGERVAPRSTCADSVLVAVFRRNRTRAESKSELTDHSLLELAKVLSDKRIDVLVCGGISREERDFLEGRRLEIIDNVVGSAEELLEAIQSGELHPGFGLDSRDVAQKKQTESKDHISEDPKSVETDDDSPKIIDCLACKNRICLDGKRCPVTDHTPAETSISRSFSQMMEAALDISFENERILCRLSELIYFCLEMQYQKIGLAYCIDLEEPTAILVRVLRRFFKVYPVCCKVGGNVISDAMTPPSLRQHSSLRVACNPSGQAGILNQIGTDMNVLVGLCMGSDCIINKMSEAPVTTLFVKDKSLANNPIGAVYSDYYLKEAIRAARHDSK